MKKKKEGTLIVLSGPSGVGKSTVIGELLKRRSQWMFMGFAGNLLCVIVSLLFKVPFGPVA